MKRVSYIVIVLILTGFFSSCENNNPTEKIVCNFNNPLTDLPWLKAEIDELVLSFQEGTPLSVSIYECIYGNEETGFLVDEGNTKSLYNCSGEVLCVMGGFMGAKCSGLNIISEKLIWTTRDLNVIISCNFDNPLTDLYWLKSSVESDYPSYRRIYQCTYKNGIGFLCETGNFEYIFRRCHGVALCSEQDGSCDRYNINFEDKQLIWEYSNKDKIDFSNIGDLFFQSLPVIQECMQGKWKWYASHGGFPSVNYHDNIFVDIHDDHYVIHNNGMQEIRYFTWKRSTVFYGQLETWVMWDTEYDRASWYFMSIKNDTLMLRSDPPPNSANIPSFFEFIRMK